ncbi:MAG TPA: DoxX family protein [Elusimicrobiota bacterium]|nr:DoxX family protein [Elusimicrobiota bacterium]
MRRLLPLAAFFVAAGTAHFVNPGFYLRFMPPYLPRPLLLVYVSGFFEIAGGVGVLIPRLRRAAAWGLVALLIAVLPANVQMLVDDFARVGALGKALLLLRLPFQLVFIRWVLWATA